MSDNSLLNRQKILLDLARSLSRIKELESLLLFIAKKTSEIMDVERCTVFLLDEEKDELWSIIATGEEGEIRFSADKGIAGYVVRTGEIVKIDDPRNDDRWNPEIDKETGFETKSLLTVPLYDYDDDISGVYQVLNKKSGKFDDEDVDMLTAISSQVSISIQHIKALESREKMFESLVETMAETIDMRDPLTAGHSRSVMHYSTRIAKKLGLSEEEIKVIKYSAYLHDYGKVGVKDRILLKPGRLNQEQRRKVEKHAEYTRRILNRIDFEKELCAIAEVAYLHHERLDGSGYPHGLRGEEIPIGARIIAVADVYDALTSRRHYRDPLPDDEAYDYLLKWSGVKFDERVVEVLGMVLENEGRIIEDFLNEAFLKKNG